MLRAVAKPQARHHLDAPDTLTGTTADPHQTSNICSMDPIRAGAETWHIGINSPTEFPRHTLIDTK